MLRDVGCRNTTVQAGENSAVAGLNIGDVAGTLEMQDLSITAWAVAADISSETRPASPQRHPCGELG